MAVYLEACHQRFETEMPFCGTRALSIVLGSNANEAREAREVAERLVDKLTSREITLLVVRKLHPGQHNSLIELLTCVRQLIQTTELAEEFQIHLDLSAAYCPEFPNFHRLAPVFPDLFVTVDQNTGNFDLLEDVTSLDRFPAEHFFVRYTLGTGHRTSLDEEVLDWVLAEHLYFVPYATFDNEGRVLRNNTQRNLSLCWELANRYRAGISYQPDLYLSNSNT